MKKNLAIGLCVLAVLISGCVAMQEDVATLQERVVTTETKLGSLEKESQRSMSDFEKEWNPKIASLSEDMLILRERISGVEGSVNTINERIRQESEKAEKFRLTTSQELLDYQKGISARMDLMQQELKQELEVIKKTQAEIAASVETLKKQVAEISSQYGVLSDRIDQFDTGLKVSRDESDKKLSVVVEEVSKENETLRDRIAALEKKVKPTSKRKD